MKKLLSLVFGLSLPALQVNAEILDVFGPFTYKSSGSEFYNVMLSVPKSIVGNCIENAGQGIVTTSYFQRYKNSHGNYSDAWGNTVKGDRIYYKTFSCTYPFLSLDEIHQSPFRDDLLKMDQLGHSYYDHGKGINPNFANPDRDSKRHRDQFIGKLHFKPSTFAGRNASEIHYAGSPFGRDAYYQRIQVICDGRNEQKPIAELTALESECSEDFLRRKAKSYMSGPTRVMFLLIDSPYYQGLFVDGV